MAVKYSQELCEEICERLSQGEPLRQICRSDHMPTWRSVYRWMDDHPDFRASIAHARELGYDAIAEECFDIADDATNDWMERKDKQGNDVTEFNKEHVQRSKLRIWTRTQLLAKWNPKKYGDRQQIDLKAQVNINEMSEADMLAELTSMGVAVPDAPHGEASGTQSASEDEAYGLV